MQQMFNSNLVLHNVDILKDVHKYFNTLLKGCKPSVTMLNSPRKESRKKAGGREKWQVLLFLFINILGERLSNWYESLS